MPEMQHHRSIFVKYPFFIGLCIRLTLMVILPFLLDDGVLLGGVKYTDIDYSVYTDAAALVQNKGNPYDRHTYRYTPFLAAILAWGAHNTSSMKWFGRVLFCIADALCGQILLLMRREEREDLRKEYLEHRKDKEEINNNSAPKEFQQRRSEWIDALWWLYNPLPINICTRGSAESLMVLFPVLLTIHVATTDAQWIRFILPFRRRSQADVIVRAGLCGFIHGIAIHSRLYPIIYTPSFMAFFSREALKGKYIDQSNVLYWENEDDMNEKKQNPKIKNQATQQMKKLSRNNRKRPANENIFFKFITFLYIWVRRILQPAPILFLFYSMLLFAVLTYAGILLYGRKALTEGLLYHFSRLDHRHNYSIYWYGIYLARYKHETLVSSIPAENFGASNFLSIMSRVLFLPQLILLFQCSMGIAPYDLSFALFLQTYVFVMFNKVITGQYFTWYLCLLPLCASRIQWKSREMNFAFGLLGMSISTWLGSAFFLEMKGYSVHFMVWMASLFVFGANLNLLRVILMGYEKNKKVLRIHLDNGQNKRKKQ